MTKETLRKEIGRNLAKLRAQKGWTQEELAERIGSNPAHVSQMETGVRGIGPRVMPKICKALGVKPGVLYGTEEGEKGEPALSPEQKRVLAWVKEDPNTYELLEAYFKLPRSKKLAKIADILAEVDRLGENGEKG